MEIFDGTLSNTYLRKYYDSSQSDQPNKNLLATVRLDDDDALHPKFSKVLFKYIKHQNIGKIVSFPKGYFVNITDQDIYYRKTVKKLIAVGISRISVLSDKDTIYCHRHKKFKKDGYSCIFNKFFPMYLVINHKWGDQGRYRKNIPNIFLDNNDTNKNIVKNNFKHVNLNFFLNL